MSKKNTPSFALNSFTDIFATPSVVTSPAGVPWYETLNCKDSVDMIFEYEEKAQESFVGMGYFLKRIKEKELFKELGYDNMWTFAKEQCHMDESAVSRFINLCERFSKDNNSPILDTRFKGYSKSQLIEMISIKDDQTMEKMNPDMTVKQIREVKKEGTKEPTDRAIRDFFNYRLSDITQEEFADLKNYLIKEYGKSHAGGTVGLSHFICSTRGIRINNFDEITWAKFVSRVYLLEDLVPDSIKNQVQEDKEDVLPGQLDLENDFPQYCPEPADQNCSEISAVTETEASKTKENIIFAIRDNCLFDKSKKCNIHNLKKVAESCGIDCKYNCCYSCDEKLCGARCNTSSANPAQKMESDTTSQQTYTDNPAEVIIDGDFREVSVKTADEVRKIKVPKESAHREEMVVEKREDSMTKYKCNTCLQQFILGDYAVKIMASNEPKCPYCGQKNLEWTSKADPGEIEDMGCMAIWAIIL